MNVLNVSMAFGLAAGVVWFIFLIFNIWWPTKASQNWRRQKIKVVTTSTSGSWAIFLTCLAAGTYIVGQLFWVLGNSPGFWVIMVVVGVLLMRAIYKWWEGVPEDGFDI